MSRQKAMSLGLAAFLALGISFARAGENSLTFTGAPSNYVGLNFNVYALGKYLSDCQVNRPEILNEVKTLLSKGEYYRKETKDQKGKHTYLTVFVDKDYILHIITYRDDDCPNCKGSGMRRAPFANITSRVDINFNCLTCKGSGLLKDHNTDKYYILSAEDFENANQGRQIMAQRAYSKAPAGAEAWVERLASNNPRDRLEACVWLDANYVRNGMMFQDVMPMLKKARYYDTNEKKKTMVWQFWAGKDMPEERNRAYYRIYADGNSGKITKKGFFPGR